MGDVTGGGHDMPALIEEGAQAKEKTSILLVDRRMLDRRGNLSLSQATNGQAREAIPRHPTGGQARKLTSRQATDGQPRELTSRHTTYGQDREITTKLATGEGRRSRAHNKALRSPLYAVSCSENIGCCQLLRKYWMRSVA